MTLWSRLPVLRCGGACDLVVKPIGVWLDAHVPCASALTLSAFDLLFRTHCCIFVGQQGPKLGGLPFKLLSGPQPRIPNPGAACAVRVKSMPGSKLLQTIKSFEYRLGTVAATYRC
jgi:hypothetical protein